MLNTDTHQPIAKVVMSPHDVAKEGAPELSIVIPVNANADLQTVKIILGDLSRYSGSMRFEVVLMVNNFPEHSVPDEIAEWQAVGVNVVAIPSVRKDGEEVFITARMIGLKAASAKYSVLFDADCQIPDPTALLDWYLDQFQRGAAVAYTQVDYYELKQDSSMVVRIWIHHSARWIKRNLLFMPTTRGSNYGVDCEMAYRLYLEGKLNKDMKIGPAIKSAGGKVAYSSHTSLRVLTSGRYLPTGWMRLVKYVGHRLRYHMNLNTALDDR